MSGQAFEYRVRWQREGLQATSQIRQTEKGAREKAERLVALDREISGEEDGPEEMYDEEGHIWREQLPPLVAPPTIERRQVGAWEPIE